MNIHKNARLTLARRLEMMQDITVRGIRPCQAARQQGVSAPTARKWRLASFGPGSIFGEVSLLSTGVRTADAWCVEPVVLHELTRSALDALAASHPALHAQVLRNLGIHLANRLVVANSTVEAQQ